MLALWLRQLLACHVRARMFRCWTPELARVKMCYYWPVVSCSERAIACPRARVFACIYVVCSLVCLTADNSSVVHCIPMPGRSCFLPQTLPCATFQLQLPVVILRLFSQVLIYPSVDLRYSQPSTYLSYEQFRTGYALSIPYILW